MANVSSFRGSGDDMMSALGVAGFAMECQRTVKRSAADVVGPDLRRFDITGENMRL